MGITDNTKLFTLADMKAAFIAGEHFESDIISVDTGEKDELTVPDFGEYMEKNFFITVENK